MVVPMKPLARSKGRLDVCLSREGRRALSLLLLRRVVQAARRCPLVTETLVVGGDPAIEQTARRLGAAWLDDAGAPLNEALQQAFAMAFEHAMEAALYLPHDVSLISSEEITCLIKASGGLSSLVLAPAWRDGGTNAILTPRQLPLRPSLGGDSFQRHLTQAKALGYPVAIYGSPRLGLDLDTEEDLYQSMEDPDFSRAVRACGIHPRERGGERILGGRT